MISRKSWVRTPAWTKLQRTTRIHGSFVHAGIRTQDLWFVELCHINIFIQVIFVASRI